MTSKEEPKWRRQKTRFACTVFAVLPLIRFFDVTMPSMDLLILRWSDPKEHGQKKRGRHNYSSREVAQMFLPTSANTPIVKNRNAYCHWCVQSKPKKELFKIRDGPVDWYFCDEMHAELWLGYRHKKETHRLCRMLPRERRKHLAGKTMEEEISRLFPKACAPSQS